MIPIDLQEKLLAQTREVDGCLLWTGGQSSKGLPRMRHQGIDLAVRSEYREYTTGIRPRMRCSPPTCGNKLCLRHLVDNSMPDRIYRRDRASERSRILGVPHLTDVTPVREHLEQLVAGGMSEQRIAAKSGASQTNVSYIRRQGENVNTYTARMILATAPDPPGWLPEGDWGPRLPGLGSQRRLQALIADGFPMQWIGERLGTERTFVKRCAHQGHKVGLFAKNRNAITALYDELEGRKPQEFPEITPFARSRARRQGEANCWPTRILWDEDTIDDPDGFPEYTGECGTLTGHSIHERDGIRVTQLVNEWVNAQRTGRKVQREFAACAACRKAKAVEVAFYAERYRKKIRDNKEQ